jgi:hypothetical protein
LEICKAPVGKVRFRDFFFADILTSIVPTLTDLGIVIYVIMKEIGFYDENDNPSKSCSFSPPKPFVTYG